MPILPGPPPVEVTLRRSARARRFSLRVSRVDGKVTLSLPLRARESEAMEFVRAQEGWLRNALAKMPSVAGVGMGAEIPVEGRMMRLLPGTGRRLVAASDHYAAQIGRKVAQVTLRDTRSRWGSCTHEGALMYSWRLVMAPPSVLTYVAAHEVAHMVEMNHSDRFWAVVDRLYPGWQPQRDWLKRQGTALHAIRFTTAAGD